MKGSLLAIIYRTRLLIKYSSSKRIFEKTLVELLLVCKLPLTARKTNRVAKRTSVCQKKCDHYIQPKILLNMARKFVE
jgi:hypothetical protein